MPETRTRRMERNVCSAAGVSYRRIGWMNFVFSRFIKWLFSVLDLLCPEMRRGGKVMATRHRLYVSALRFVRQNRWIYSISRLFDIALRTYLVKSATTSD